MSMPRKVNKIVSRITSAEIMGKPIIVEIHPNAVKFRLKHSRSSISATWEELYGFAQTSGTALPEASPEKEATPWTEASSATSENS